LWDRKFVAKLLQSPDENTRGGGFKGQSTHGATYGEIGDIPLKKKNVAT